MTKLARSFIGKPFNFWRRSIRRQFILAFSSVTISILVLFSTFLFFQQRDFLDRSAIRQATAFAHALADSSTSWVLANDVVGLQEVLHGFIDTPDLKRAFVLSLQGEVLASTIPDEIGRFVIDPLSQKMLRFSPETQILVANYKTIDVAAPIMTGQRHVGWARITLNRHSAYGNLLELSLLAIFSTLLGALFALLAAFVLGRRLTKNLNQLMTAANQISAGRRDVRVAINGLDEVAILAGNFNQMLQALIDSEKQRKLITNVYAAWTQCAEVMVRVSEEREFLRQICQILAKQLSLQLAWVGMIDENAWLKPVAASPEHSAYLSQIKVSVDADLPEGQGAIGQALRQGQPRILNDFTAANCSRLWHEAASAENINSVGAFPLFRAGRVIGVLAIYSKERNFFNRELSSLMNGLTNDISFALDNFDLIRRQKITEEKLKLDACVFDNSQEGIIITDTDFHIVSVNHGFTRITGYHESEVINLLADAIVAPADLPRYQSFLEIFSTTGIWQGEINHRRQDGSHYPAWVSITNAIGERGNITHHIIVFSDITARKQAEQELKIAAIAFETEEGILVTDAQGKILRVNQAFTRLTGYRADEVIGNTPAVLKSGKHDEHFYQRMWDTIKREGHWEGEIWNRRKNNEVYPEWLTINNVRNQDGVITNYVGIFSDISQRKAAEDQIRKLAFYDPLTGLPNRRFLIERLELALTTSHRTKSYGAMMFLDLDRFKALNDTQGHDSGDSLLIQVAQRLQDCVRETDTVARLGGDEFVVILEDLDKTLTTAALQAKSIAKKIHQSLSLGYRIQPKGKEQSIHYFTTASIGFVMFQNHDTSTEELLKYADMAMYQAKHAGRNAIRAYDPDLQRTLSERAALELDLRNALDEEQLRPYYQIQVDSEEQPLGAELLLRWNHPDRGFIAPDEFIPIAEESGMIHEIGRWLLLQGCRTLVSWSQNTLKRDLTLSVNVSAKQFYHTDIVEQVRTVLQETGADPARLKLEITESFILHNVEEVIDKMQAIAALGVTFSMDDFGTGYSSLSYLQKLPLEQLKIDRSFVRDISSDKQDAAIVRTILSLGQTLGMKIVAEGVENQAQFDYLKQNGCQIFQGYLFGKPVPRSLFETNLARSASTLSKRKRPGQDTNASHSESKRI